MTTNIGFRGEIRENRFLNTANVPTTIPSLNEMAKNCLNYLEGNPNPQLDYECKFALGPLGLPLQVPISPPNQYGFDTVSIADTDLRMDLVYPYMRLMSDTLEKGVAEKGVRKRADSYLNEQWLCTANPSALTGLEEDGLWVMPWGCSHNVLFYCDEYERTSDIKWLQKAKSVMEQIILLATEKGNMLYMPFGIAAWREGQWLTDKGWMKEHQCTYAFMVEPIVRIYEISKDEKWISLANRFAEGILNGVQPNQGVLAINPNTGEFQKHVHLHTRTIWGMAHLGAITDNARYTLWAKQAYDFVVDMGTDYGWYPEYIPQENFRSETCVIGDMLAIGYWLAKAGFTAEYDRMERTYINYLKPSQLFINDEFKQIFKKAHPELSEDETNNAFEELKSIEGGFVAQITLNDLISYPKGLEGNGKIGNTGLYENGIHMMGCCPPSGMLGLYHIWKALAQKEDNKVFINMSLTATTPYAQIIVDYKKEKKLSLTALCAGDFYIRIPQWSDISATKTYVNGQICDINFDGPGAAYIKVNNVEKGDLIEIDYPIATFTQTFLPKVNPKNTQEFTVEWYGNSVVNITPQGEYMKLF